MNCTKCALEITTKHDSLKCRGICGNHFHLSCLSSANKAYKKALIAALLNIQNLLWFCDDCLPNITDTFPSHGNDTQPHEHNQTFQTNQSLGDLVSIDPLDSFRSQHANDIENPDAQASTSLDNLVSSISTSSTDQVQQDGSIQMVIDDIETGSMEHAEINANKRRRLSNNDDDNATKGPIPSAPAAPKFSSTNYRCIYLTSFKPSASENDIIKYIASKNRDSTEIMDCKKLLPAKCNLNRISFISFKLTVHKEFYGFYVDPKFWPNGVKAEEFDLRPPKKRQTIRKLRVNPFAVPSPSQFHLKQNTAKSMMRTHSNWDSYSPPNRHDLNRTHRTNNYSGNSNFRSNDNHRFPRSNESHRSSYTKQKNHQHQFTNHTSRRYHHQTTRQNNISHQNRGQRIMDPEQLMALFEQLNWQMKSLLNHR